MYVVSVSKNSFMANFPSNTLSKWMRFDNNDNVIGDNGGVKTQVFVSTM